MTMQVSVIPKWMILLRYPKCFTQCVNVVGEKAIVITFGQIHREKVSACGDRMRQ
ncbi:MAG: hypothetical protein JWR25_2106 [Noviherbaspirillum sp.]|nr:hypothetical protein [Noviherbaspirillum sp.]